MHWQKIAEQILAIQDAAEESNRIVMLNLLGYRSLIPVTSKKKKLPHAVDLTHGTQSLYFCDILT